MPSIDVDFEVFKALTSLRPTEDVTYNDVIRSLLKLPPASGKKPGAAKAICVFKGIPFPEGTQFRAAYKGQVHTAEIKGGRWVGSDGEVRKSPSDAATRVTKTPTNGWTFWHVKRPGEPSWTRLTELR